MVPFAGWNMPIQYGNGILSETRAVRNFAGLFDVSHMGRIFVDGADARSLLNWVHSSKINPEMNIGRARYGLFCNENGGIIDDGIIYRLGDSRYLLIANASNTSEVLDWLTHWTNAYFSNVRLENATSRIGMIALQGPEAIKIFSALSDFNPSLTKPFNITQCKLAGKSVLAARTGYTGEDGLEIMPDVKDCQAIWNLLVSKGVAPAGLGARDILRMEAALPLHGNEISPSTNPIEAGLDRFLDSASGAFCGSEALEIIRNSTPVRELIGFQALVKGALPRPHSTLLSDGLKIGEVSSGGYSPTLDRNIGLGYVQATAASIGNRLQIDVRGRLVEAEVVQTPFYKRPR